MKPNEEEAFEKHYGYKPTAIRVAIDALAVFVHKDNPIKGLSIEQVDAIFSSTTSVVAAISLAGVMPVWTEAGLPKTFSCTAVTQYPVLTVTSRRKRCVRVTSKPT